MQVIIFLLGCSAAHASNQLAWIEKSNQLAQEYALESAERYPEGATAIGYREFDGKAIQIENDMETKDMVFLKKWRSRLTDEIKSSTNLEYRTDVEVLLQTVENSIAGNELFERFGDIPFHPATKSVFGNLRDLINEQSDEVRKKAAVDRFKLYVNGHGKFKPLLEAYQSRISFREKKAFPKGFYPLRKEIEQYLSESSEYLEGIKKLLEQSGRADWQEDFVKFSKQVEHYDAFLKKNIIIKARTDYKLPKEIYSHILRIRGITATPEELIEVGLSDYKSVYKRFEITAREVAKKLKLKVNNPVSVLRHLKAKQVTQIGNVKKLYVEADRFLSKLIDSQGIVTLPKTPLKIRFADEAESKANPVPHLEPPPLVNNKGERPEFVVPTSSTGKLPFDDFSYMAAALILTAHEGRPGHDLQFSTMLDDGTSIIRARYAFNNVNVEGWGLYAEDLVYPNLPAESRLAALQMRLWRIARSFLDPQVQLGQTQTDQVVRLFTKELGVSEVMANLEVRRYTYDDPGQAPTYYYGLKKILEMKATLRRKIGIGFREKCFNDAVLAMGLLPLDLIKQKLIGTLNCKI